MAYFVIVISVACVAFFIWTSMKSEREEKKHEKDEEKPVFHTDSDQEAYSKPVDPPPVDFDDAE